MGVMFDSLWATLYGGLCAHRRSRLVRAMPPTARTTQPNLSGWAASVDMETNYLRRRRAIKPAKTRPKAIMLAGSGTS